uniref:Uncharacterized protein n=1 Tax=Myotis myotis TaxID=51298 RepID=A0A7J7SRL5_MYOMY|nr:hypothetical protein mMyoMyo1_009374 [Myotis myotis]
MLREKERERGCVWGRERKKRERLIACLLYASPIRNQTHNPGMCPDPEPNRQLFGAQDNTPPTELCQRGMTRAFLMPLCWVYISVYVYKCICIFSLFSLFEVQLSSTWYNLEIFYFSKCMREGFFCNH